MTDKQYTRAEIEQEIRLCADTLRYVRNALVDTRRKLAELEQQEALLTSMIDNGDAMLATMAQGEAS